jgi:hypothetical protein
MSFAAINVVLAGIVGLVVKNIIKHWFYGKSVVDHQEHDENQGG